MKSRFLCFIRRRVALLPLAAATGSLACGGGVDRGTDNQSSTGTSAGTGGSSATTTGGNECTQIDCADLPRPSIACAPPAQGSWVCSASTQGRCTWHLLCACEGSCLTQDGGPAPSADATFDEPSAPPFSDAGVQFPATYPAAACTALPAGPAVPTTTEAFISLLTGRWLRCDGSVFLSTNDVGLEFTADGTWYKLYPGLPGMVRRGQTFEERGTWTLLDQGSGFFQLNMDIFGSGSIFVHPAFAAMPRQMALDNMGLRGTYAIDGP